MDKSSLTKKDNETQIAELREECDRLEKKYREIRAETVSLMEQADKRRVESRQSAIETARSIGSGVNYLNDSRQSSSAGRK